MLCLAQLTVVLDNTVLTVAVPVLTTELAATTTDIQWMINAYALVQCGLLLSAGSAADRYGRRRMLVAGLVLFGVGSLAAGLARSGDQLIAARAGMGVGGALLVTATLAVAMQVFPGAERSRAIGIWAATSAFGYAAGPPIGGVILTHLPWGAIFLVNVPIALVCLVATGRWCRSRATRSGAAPTSAGRCCPPPASPPWSGRSSTARNAAGRHRPCSARPPPACCCSPPSSAGNGGSPTRCWTCTSSATAGSSARSPGSC